MKMTTEQFLSHLGIEVGKPFMCDGNHTVITKSDLSDEPKIFRMEQKDTSPRYSITGIAWFIDKEIIPLPKYTLTEDEKAIVRLEYVGEKICVYRYASGRLSVKVDGNDVISLDDDLFPFIDYEDFLSLDDLRKCL